MKSVYSDPISHGIDAFTKVAGLVDQMENSRARREMMAQDAADRRLRREREAKDDQRKDVLWDRAQEEYYGRQNLNNILSAYQKASDAQTSGKTFDPTTLTDDEAGSVLFMLDEKNFFDKDGKFDRGKMEHIRTIQNVMNAPQIQSAMKNKGKLSLLLDAPGNKKLGEAINSIYGSVINKGVGGAGDKAEKRAKAALLDFSADMPTVAFGLEVKPQRGGAGNIIPLQGYEKNVFSAPEAPNPKDQLEPGNIDLSQRKVAINQDGSISTVLSTSFNIDGKEVLLPLVNNDGKIVTKEEAVKEYKDTGKHLGIFKTPDAATQYAETLSNSKIWGPTIEYYKQDSYDAPMTFGRDGDQNAPVQQIPAPLLAMQITSLQQLGDWATQLENKYGSTKISEQVKAIRHNKTIADAYRQSGGDRKKFIDSLMERGMPEDAKKYSDLFKTSPKLSSQKGKELTDLSILIEEHGKDSPIVKKFEGSIGKSGKQKQYRKNPKTGEDEVSEDGGMTWGARFSPRQRSGGPASEKNMSVAKDKITEILTKQYLPPGEHKSVRSYKASEEIPNEAKEHITKIEDRAYELVNEENKSPAEAIAHAEKELGRADTRPIITQADANNIKNSLEKKLGRRPTKQEAIAEAEKRGFRFK